MSESRPYHHGALRVALLAAARDAIAESGPSGWSLRDVARRAGVSHAAPAHHFGDKTGLLTAIATDGYRALAAGQEAAWRETGNALELGVAYVRFALANAAAFQVMYRPHLLDSQDPDLVAAQVSATGPLFEAMEAVGGGDPSFDPASAAVAAWSLVHGFATLWLDGDLPVTLGTDPEAAVRLVAAHLFRPRPSRSGPIPTTDEPRAGSF
jgi:AcrR family transcriptional regulator